MTIVDARGERCPRPLILTRQALRGVATGAPMRVQIDNETSRANVERFLVDHGVAVTVTREGSTITCARPAGSSSAATPSTTGRRSMGWR